MGSRYEELPMDHPIAEARRHAENLLHSNFPGAATYAQVFRRLAAALTDLQAENRKFQQLLSRTRRQVYGALRADIKTALGEDK